MVFEPTSKSIEADLSDVIVRTARGSGKGGQHRNKTDSRVTMVDKATGLKVQIDGRDQHHNRRIAKQVLSERIISKLSEAEAQRMGAYRKEQAGSGMRGDKVRTYREQDGIVTDHASERKAQLRQVLQGNLSLLW